VGVGEEGSGKREGAEISARTCNASGDRKPDLVLLDVREPREADIARIEGARLIPLRDLPRRLGELPARAEIVNALSSWAAVNAGARDS